MSEKSYSTLDLQVLHQPKKLHGIPRDSGIHASHMPEEVENLAPSAEVKNLGCAILSTFSARAVLPILPDQTHIRQYPTGQSQVTEYLRLLNRHLQSLGRNCLSYNRRWEYNYCHLILRHR